MIKLRDYQQQCLADLARHRAEHPDETRLAVVMATGLGKTFTLAVEACEFLGSFEGAGNRVLALVHTDELAQQAEAKVGLVAGDDFTVGVVKAERDEVDADIVIGSVQTLANPARRARLTDVGHIIVDECHHAIAPAYQAILQYYGAFREPDPVLWPTTPPITVTGYTATLERGDGNSLGSVWQNVAFSRSISWAVRKGFLVPPRAYRVEVPELQLYAPDGTGRDITAINADAAMTDSIAPERIVEAWTEHAKGRSTVLFAPLVRSARAFQSAFTHHGVTSRVIHGELSPALRRLFLAEYERGEVQVLCNAMVLTEGWDSPRTECVIVARPTKSRPLFIQMAGRGLRPWLAPEAVPREMQDCVLLVVADATTELASMADLSDRPIEHEDGKTLIAMEDQWDIGAGLEDPEHTYDGKVHVSEFDPLVQKSSKVWSTTKGGTLFLPAGDNAWVFVAPAASGWSVWRHHNTHTDIAESDVPDLELAMTLAEDAATDLGGNLTALYADKGRAWRKKVPSQEMLNQAWRVSVPHAAIVRILNDKRSGKAGRLSDLIDITRASRRIDPVVANLR